MSIDKINSQGYINLYKSNFNRKLNNVTKFENRDRIEISEVGRGLSGYSQVDNFDNSKKVNELKVRIENDTYNIKAETTAKSILNFIRESKLENDR